VLDRHDLSFEQAAATQMCGGNKNVRQIYDCDESGRGPRYRS
jgi:hypothetical protein